MIATDQDAFLLLAFLLANNGLQRAFLVANGLADRLGWTRKRLPVLDDASNGATL
jgi:hypothetical protein